MTELSFVCCGMLLGAGILLLGIVVLERNIRFGPFK